MGIDWTPTVFPEFCFSLSWGLFQHFLLIRTFTIFNTCGLTMDPFNYIHFCMGASNLAKSREETKFGVKTG